MSSLIQHALTDAERARLLLGALAPEVAEAETRTVIIPGEPYSKSRPRFRHQGRAYSAPGDVAAEARIGWELRRVFRQPWTGNIAVGCVFFRSSKRAVDADNCIKCCCDAGNGVAWQDDSQITAVYGIVELDRDNPRTLLVVARHLSTMGR
jgi:Holliday junction resolvase RusA-like endonuclease